MSNKEVAEELKGFINNCILTRLENDLPIIKEQIIKKSEVYLNLLNEEYKTIYMVDIERLVNKELYKLV